MGYKTSPSNFGTVVSVRGSVVDIRFEEHLPPIYTVLRAGDEQRIVIDVLAQRDARHVRGIAGFEALAGPRQPAAHSP
jgi:F-type H+-transporting ATPase subunit beta